MDLGWCPVCDKQTFAIENLYCSEACRKKDASSSILDEKSCCEFPRCSSQKPYQSPYNSPYNSPYSSPYSSPGSSPKLQPTRYETNILIYGMISSDYISEDSTLKKTKKISNLRRKFTYFS
jgi:hypothetical protein